MINNSSLQAEGSLLQAEGSFWKKCGVKSIDHIAVTTVDLNHVLHDYLGIEGCELLRGPGVNESQNVDYAFVRTSQGMTIEILGVRKNSPISEHVKKGGGAYHLCFLVNDLDDAVETAQKNGAVKIVGQREDDAFDGRRVAFLMHPEHGLFEFLEAYPSSSQISQTQAFSEAISKPTSKNSDEFPVQVKGSSRIAEEIILKAFQTVFPDLTHKEVIEHAELGVTANWDSLHQLLLIMELEKLAQIKFTVNELAKITSYQKILTSLVKKID